MIKKEGMMECRRRAVLKLSPRQLLNALSSGKSFKFSCDGDAPIPDNLKFIAITSDWQYESFNVMVESENLPCIPINQTLPCIGNMIVKEI